MLYGMARAGAMPRVLATVHPRRGTPIAALVTGVVVAAGFAVLGDFTLIAAVTDFAVYVVFLAVNASVILLRRTRPDLARPFAVPGAIAGVPVIPVVGLASVALMMTQLAPSAIALGTAMCATGVIAAGLARSGR
jgi:APA family basic amino acid/polyamine antiporter